MQDADKWYQRVQDWDAAFKRETPWLQEVLDGYRNRFAPGLLTVNLLFSYGRSLVPQLYFKNPVVAVNIRRKGFEDVAKTIRDCDDALIEATRLKEALKRMILSAHLTGRGVIKVGYNTEPAPESWPGMDRNFPGMTPTMPVWKMREILGPDRPWVLDFDVQDFAWDSDMKRLRDSGWFAMRFRKKVYEIQDDPVLGDIDHSDDEEEEIEYWEVWDKFSGKFRTLHEAEWCGPEHDINYWPFKILDFNDCLDSAYGISDAHLMLAQQREINETKTQIAEHRRVSLLKLLAKRNAIQPADKARLEKGIVGALIEIDADPQTAVMPFQPQIPVNLYTDANTTKEDIRDVLGFTRNQLGEFDSRRRTAMEAQIVQQSLQLRLDERRDMVADCMREIVVTKNDMIFDHWDVRKVEQWAGQADGWEKVPQVRATYVVSIVPDSTLPLSRTLQKQEAQALFGSLRQDPLIDPIWLRKYYLGQFDGIDPSQAISQQAQARVQQAQAGPSGGQAMPPGFPVAQPAGNGNPA